MTKVLQALGDISKTDPTAFVSVRSSEFSPFIEQDEPEIIFGLPQEKKCVHDISI